MPAALWIGGCFFALGLIWPGVLMRSGRRNHWIAGYNTSSPAERRKYDIDGMAEHLGGGLIALGLTLLIATVTVGFGWTGWFLGSIGVFLFVAFLTVIGGFKFTPRALHPPPGESGHLTHLVLRKLTSETTYRKMEAGTRQWQYVCGCGHTLDYWESGGVRWKAAGEPREMRKCELCGKTSMQRVCRKRTA